MKKGVEKGGGEEETKREGKHDCIERSAHICRWLCTLCCARPRDATTLERGERVDAATRRNRGKANKEGTSWRTRRGEGGKEENLSPFLPLDLYRVISSYRPTTCRPINPNEPFHRGIRSDL